MDEDLLTQEESEVREDTGWIYAIVTLDPETEQVLAVEELE
jgi:hypothetical protein